MNKRIGIDLGSLYLKIVQLSPSGETTRYLPHQGNPIWVLKEELARLDTENALFGITGANARLVTDHPIDWIQAEVHAIKQVFPLVRNIIDVGGGSLTLIRLDEEGSFRDYATNSLCAAGTGSFLDEQAARLGIRYEDLDGFSYPENPPSIATRCSVFAKSDLIHRQQEGHSREAMWSGLCRGLTHTFMQTLLGGKPLEGLTVLTGGVSLNLEVLRWLRASYGAVETYHGAHLAAARGAAELATSTL
ncbi:MAG: BadF/BadG/BcrA/BcrD ATPase family protein, partial [Bacteroidota bacterium]